jgi:hypothetical protein
MTHNRPLIRVRLDADDIPDGEIALADLAKVASSTQKFLRQIAGNLVGQRGPGAPRKGVIEASSLRLVGLKPGSTILEIAGADIASHALDYDIPTDLTELSFDMLVGGLSAISSDDPQPDLPVGFDKQLVDDLDDWLKSVRQYKSVALEAQVRSKTKVVKTVPRRARARLHNLSPQPVLPFVSPTEQALEGKLYALNLNTGSFSIEDDAGHKIRTNLPPELRSDAAVLINRRVRAIGKPELDESGRIKVFAVSSLGPAPDLAGLSEQKGFFDPHELDVKPPAGESGSLDEWAIGELSDEEADDFMDALATLR